MCCGMQKSSIKETDRSDNLALMNTYWCVLSLSPLGLVLTWLLQHRVMVHSVDIATMNVENLNPLLKHSKSNTVSRG